MVIDPFTVPIDDYQRVLGAMHDMCEHVPPQARISFGYAIWRDDLRVFASTAGSLVTQHMVYGGARGSAYVADPYQQGNGVQIDVIGMDNDRPGGFERLFQQIDTIPHIREGIDDAIRLVELPLRPFRDVGRFPIVFDGVSFASLFGMTVNQALDGDRVFGIERDAAGGSFLTPVGEVLNASMPTYSPLLTVTSDRALPTVCAARWDDDGVEASPYTLIERGRVVDYHTTRETAPMLADWYTARRRPVQSHGTCVAPTPVSVPMGSGGHVQIAPAAGTVRRDDLLRELTHGFFIRRGRATPSAGLTLSGCHTNDVILEVRNGVPIARSRLTLQVVTKSAFQKSLIALGDSTTLRTTTVDAWKGVPWQHIEHQVTAPAALCKDIDVVIPLGLR